MAVLGYLPKLERGLGLAFAAHFPHDFSIKMFFIWYSIDGQSFNIPFFLLKYQTKCVIEFLFRKLMTQTLRFIFDQPPKQWLTGKKEGKMEIQKFEYLENEKSFLDEIKSTFHSFWRNIIWWKNRNLMKIADTSFYHIDWFLYGNGLRHERVKLSFITRLILNKINFKC